MSKHIRILAADQFVADSRYRGWLGYEVQKDADNRLFVMLDLEDGSFARVDEGDFVLTQVDGERLAMKHFDFIKSDFDPDKVVNRIEVL